MTTIAANKQCMASDSNVVTGKTFFEGRPKIIRIGDAIVGAAGHVTAINKFVRWLQKKNPRLKKPEFTKKETLTALVLTTKGLFQIDEGLEFDEVVQPYFAIGTGALVALTAMDFGASPERAVEAACKRDPKQFTKGPVHVLWLKRDS